MNRSQHNNIKKRIKKILEDQPNTRDSDPLLYLQYIYFNHPEVTFLSFAFFLHKLETKEIPSMESVSRLSRMVKQKYSGLCGVSRKEKKQRQAEIQAEFSRHMNYENQIPLFGKVEAQ